MRNVICDTCEKEIEEKYLEICILHFGVGSDSEEEEEGTYQFCSERCMGKWMVEKAKEDYGVYE